MATNKAVLSHLRMACYRQIPWRRRPPLFNRLLSCGMIEIQRVSPEVNGRAPDLFEIAALTSMGSQELDRLQGLALGADWESIAQKAYEAGDQAIILRGKGEERHPGTKQ